MRSIFCPPISTSQLLISTLTMLGALTHELSELLLTGCGEVSGGGILAIAEGCPRLEKLHISNTQATDDAVVEVAKKCPELRELHAMGCCGVGNASLVALGEHCEHLSLVDVRGSGYVTEEVVQELKRARPAATLRANAQHGGVW